MSSFLGRPPRAKRAGWNGAKPQGQAHGWQSGPIQIPTRQWRRRGVVQTPARVLPAQLACVTFFLSSRYSALYSRVLLLYALLPPRGHGTFDDAVVIWIIRYN